MKKYIALLLAVCTFVLAGCTPTQDAPTNGSQKSAIESVFAQRTKLKASEGKTGLLSKENLRGFMAIDVQSCPADFRSAWFDYLVEVQNLHTRMERVAMIATAEGKPANNLPSLIRFAATNGTLGQYLLDALNRVDDSWNKLDRTAMNYGVMPEH